MGDAGGHYYAFALVKDIWLSVHGKAALPSSTVTRASPPEAWVLISSPFSKANRVRLTLSFCTRVRLTICPSL